MAQQKKPTKNQNGKTPVILLGVPDGVIEREEDTDPYITKLGGLPVWLNNETPPSRHFCRCQLCGSWLYLLCQSYVPLPDSVYHRVLYVWGCNRRTCMRKEGSFVVLRSHLVDEAYLRAKLQKEKKIKEQEQQKKNQPSGFGTPQGFQLGDVWGASKSFGSSTTGTSGFGMTIQKKNDEDPTEILSEKLGSLCMKEPVTPKATECKELPVNTSALPSFPGEYLYITPEDTQKQQGIDIDLSRYQEYLDLEANLLSADDDKEEGTWASEQYEKQQLPRGVDKQFKKFMDRVAYEPTQCIRYDWDGSPLLYHQHNREKQVGKCDSCGSPRVFEMQLMPNVLSVLPAGEYASHEVPPSSLSSSSLPQGRSTLDSLNNGMEFGTILIYVCKNDCHPGDMHDVTFVKESAIVQYEMD